MRFKVSENGLLIPPSLLIGLEEVEVNREGDVISIEKVKNIETQETINISIVKGESAKNLLAEKLKEIKASPNKRSSDPAKIALGEKFSQLCKEVQNSHADNPLSEAEIALEIDTVRSSQ